MALLIFARPKSTHTHIHISIWIQIECARIENGVCKVIYPANTLSVIRISLFEIEIFRRESQIDSGIFSPNLALRISINVDCHYINEFKSLLKQSATMPDISSDVYICTTQYISSNTNNLKNQKHPLTIPIIYSKYKYRKIYKRIKVEFPL